MQCAFLKRRKLLAQFMPLLNTIDNKRLFHETEKHLFFNERLGRPEYIFLKKNSINEIHKQHQIHTHTDFRTRLIQYTEPTPLFRLIYHA